MKKNDVPPWHVCIYYVYIYLQKIKIVECFHLVLFFCSRPWSIGNRMTNVYERRISCSIALARIKPTRWCFCTLEMKFKYSDQEWQKQIIRIYIRSICRDISHNIFLLRQDVIDRYVSFFVYCFSSLFFIAFVSLCGSCMTNASHRNANICFRFQINQSFFYTEVVVVYAIISKR